MRLVLVVAIMGWASQYDPGVMESVIGVRQSAGRTSYTLPTDLPQVSSFIAVRDCSNIGDVWFIRPEGGEWERALVTDCAGIADGGLDWMIKNNVVVEVDHETAVRWNTVGKGKRVQIGRLVYRYEME